MPVGVCNKTELPLITRSPLQLPN